jgi:hypothetical protein
MINGILLLSPDQAVVSEDGYLVLYLCTFLLEVSVETILDIGVSRYRRLLDRNHWILHLVQYDTNFGWHQSSS